MTFGRILIKMDDLLQFLCIVGYNHRISIIWTVNRIEESPKSRES